MKVALRLFNQKSKKFVDMIMKNTSVQLLYFVDADDHKWGDMEKEYNIPYISPYKLLSLMECGDIDRLIISPFCSCNVINDVIEESIEMGIKKEYIVIPNITDIYRIEKEGVFDLFSCTVDEYKTLARLQYHIADHCNLNCVSCSHFSSLVGEQFMDISELRRDLEQLKQLVHHIDMIDILGGEPFLNNEWKEFVLITKEVYPYSKITIITNGLLIWTLKDEDWEFMRENEVQYRMSLYKPMWNRAEEVVQTLKNRGIDYNVNYRVMSQFATMFLKNPKENSIDNRINCASECLQLYHGKMTPCSRMMYVGFFNKYYNLDYPEDVAVNSIYEIESFAELKHKLNQPMSLCKYCNIHLKNQIMQDWSTMNPGGIEQNSIDKWIS